MRIVSCCAVPCCTVPVHDTITLSLAESPSMNLSDSLTPPTQAPSKLRSPGGARVTNIAAMIRRREANMCGTGRFTRAQCAHVTAFRSLPYEPVQRVDRMRSRIYTGRFSRSGNLFVGVYSHHACLQTLQLPAGRA